MLLNRNKLITRSSLKKEKVVLNAETNEYVYVREMTGEEREAWEKSLYSVNTDELKSFKKEDFKMKLSLENFRGKLIVCTICDENGKLLLRSTDVKTITKNMSASNMEKIVRVAQRLNAISQEEEDEITKN